MKLLGWLVIHKCYLFHTTPRFNFVEPLLVRRQPSKSRQFPSHISLGAKQSVSVGRASLPRSLTSFRLASSHPPYRSPNCVNLVPDHRRISHTADSLGPSRKFDLMWARTGMRFIERSLRAHDIFVIPHGWHSKYPEELRDERASLLPCSDRTATAVHSSIIELGCPPSGANVKITTAERLAGL